MPLTPSYSHPLVRSGVADISVDIVGYHRRITTNFGHRTRACAMGSDPEAEPLPMEFCHTCFTLRHVQSGRFVGVPSATDLKRIGGADSMPVSLSTEPQAMWRWRAGTFGTVGELFEGYITRAGWEHGRRMLLAATPSSPESPGTWSRQRQGDSHWSSGDPWPCGGGLGDDSPDPDCKTLRWRAYAPAAFDATHPLAVPLFTCAHPRLHPRSVANAATGISMSTVHGAGTACDNGTGTLLPLLRGAEHATASFDFVCDPTCGMGLTGAPMNAGGGAVIALLATLGMAPIIVRTCADTMRRFGSRASSQAAATSEYLGRGCQQSLAWFLTLQLSWLALLGGLAPLAMWRLADAWSNRADRYLPLCIVGATGMLLSLRADDPLTLPASVALGIAACLLLIGGLLCASLPRDTTCDGSVDVFMHCPWSGSYQTWALDVPRIAPLAVYLASAALFTVRQPLLRDLRGWARLLRPHHSHRCEGALNKGPRPLARLWHPYGGSGISCSS